MITVGDLTHHEFGPLRPGDARPPSLGMSLRGSQKSPPWWWSGRVGKSGGGRSRRGSAAGSRKPEIWPGNRPGNRRKSGVRLTLARGGISPNFPRNPGFPKKCQKIGKFPTDQKGPSAGRRSFPKFLSRMGELLNTLRNVQNSGARPAPPGPGNPGFPGSAGRVRDPGFPAPPAPGNPGPEGGSWTGAAGPDFAPPGSPRPTPRSRGLGRRDVTPTGERSWSRDPGPDSDRSAGWWSVTDPTGVWQMTRRDGDDGHPIKTFPIGRRVMTTSRSAAPPVMSRPKKNSVGGRRS